MQLALPSIEQALNRKLRLPPCIPPFNKTGYRLFTALWIAVFVLAIAGPVAGFYLRYTEPANNSQLLLGSRAGFAVSPGDATLIRFPVGPQPASSHIVAGDRITAIYGLPLPKSMESGVRPPGMPANVNFPPNFPFLSDFPEQIMEPEADFSKLR